MFLMFWISILSLTSGGLFLSRSNSVRVNSHLHNFSCATSKHSLHLSTSKPSSCFSVLVLSSMLRYVTTMGTKSVVQGLRWKVDTRQISTVLFLRHLKVRHKHPDAVQCRQHTT
jgi:hypothetical protein